MTDRNVTQQLLVEVQRLALETMDRKVSNLRAELGRVLAVPEALVTQLRTELDEALAKVETLRAACLEVMSGEGAGYCPACGQHSDEGHDAGCPVDATAPDAPSSLDAVRAEAWDEGFRHGFCGCAPAGLEDNPYRARTTDGGGDE